MQKYCLIKVEGARIRGGNNLDMLATKIVAFFGENQPVEDKRNV